MATTTVSIEAHFYWNLIYSDRNNTSDVYKVTYTTEHKRETSRREILAKVDEQSRSNSLNGCGVISAGGKVSGADLRTDNWENTKEISDTVRETVTAEDDFTISESVKLERQYDIEPGESLFVYQRIFSSPGVKYQQDMFQYLDKTISEHDQSGKVELKYSVAHAVYVSAVQVVYGTEGYMAPPNRIKEAQGRSDDINATFGGKYVWLVPEYTSDKDKALTGIGFVMSDSANSNYNDLAAGAGGKYRYLIPEVDASKSQKIGKLDLWRLGDGNTDGIGSKGRTGDLNKDRKGDYLYLGWDYVPN
ncbi:hypothetical protein VKT23_008663 [Stygiomarasmius scandens]|uniref:Uncharacterized protein n=1 Tax=Marasmiellus scandens TaxID=2682957 RepID=A0ABR1JJM1_9AGAR